MKMKSDKTRAGKIRKGKMEEKKGNGLGKGTLHPGCRVQLEDLPELVFHLPGINRFGKRWGLSGHVKSRSSVLRLRGNVVGWGNSSLDVTLSHVRITIRTRRWYIVIGRNLSSQG